MANDVRFADEIVQRCENTIMPKVRFLIAANNNNGVKELTAHKREEPIVQTPPPQTPPPEPSASLQDLADLRRQLDALSQMCHGNSAQIQQFQHSSLTTDTKFSSVNNRISDLEGRPFIDYKLLDTSIRDLQNQMSNLTAVVATLQNTPLQNASPTTPPIVPQAAPSFDPTNLEASIASMQAQISAIQQAQLVAAQLTSSQITTNQALIFDPSNLNAQIATLTAKNAQLEASLGVLYQYLLANNGTPTTPAVLPIAQPTTTPN